MIRKIILNENDIRDAISKAFEVSKDNVILEMCDELVGYGLSEHYETVIKAEIIEV